MKDSLGDRMKSNYEDRYRIKLPRRTYTIIRLDGKAFHTYTKGLERPFDPYFSSDMSMAAAALVSELQGAQFAYTQSDEISVLITDFKTRSTEAPFDGNLQKLCSVSASIVTAQFNLSRAVRHASAHLLKAAHFDARVFVIPDPVEVENYFIWRQKDCTRNSLSMLAQHHFSHSELQGRSQADMHEMLHDIGINWATDTDPKFRNGTLITAKPREVNGFAISAALTWTQERDELKAMIPTHGYEDENQDTHQETF